MGKERKEWLLKSIREAWMTETIPMDEELNWTLPIYKKGDWSDCNNYRPMCLATVAFKVYTSIPELREVRQTTDNLFKLNNIIEKKI